MTCCSDSACACLPWPRSWATSLRPAGRWAWPDPLLRLEAEAGALRPRRAAGEGAEQAAHASQIGPHLEHRILAFAVGHPCFGPRRISAELAREKWGGLAISENGVWCVLKRFNLNTRSKRLALIARHADPYERKPEVAPMELHIDASVPGEKVQTDCFYVA